MGLFGDPKMATCPRCSEPLISTCMFARYEFYCLCCGHKCGFLSPRPAEPTPELEARHAELQAEWGLIVDGRHDAYGDEARERDVEARKWLRERAAA